MALGRGAGVRGGEELPGPGQLLQRQQAIKLVVRESPRDAEGAGLERCEDVDPDYGTVPERS